MVVKVAFLIPVYEDQDRLDRTLKSLGPLKEEASVANAQCALVIVDDGSRYRLAIPKQVGGVPVVSLRINSNVGITKALNHGLAWIIEEGGFDYVSRIDAGDKYVPGRLLKQIVFLEDHGDFALVGGQAKFVDANGAEVFAERRVLDDSEIRRVMHIRSCFVHAAMMLRISALRDVGLYDASYKVAQDYELTFRIARKYRVQNLGCVVVESHVYSDGISSRKRRLQIVTRIRIMLKYFRYNCLAAYVGVTKSVVLLVVPAVFVRACKRRLGAMRPSWL